MLFGVSRRLATVTTRSSWGSFHRNIRDEDTWWPWASVCPTCGPSASSRAIDTRIDLAAFRGRFYDCLTTRRDALFELTDAVLCSGGAVRTLVKLPLTPERRRGHGALYDGLGGFDIDRLRNMIAAESIPRDREGAIVLAVDVRAWPRPDARRAHSVRSATCTGAARDGRS
ncbi:transposase [Rhodococcus aetherivorans]|uniref:transposase n=1 Tax=Rhodococcus TaxID=1827 RepID=UPI00279624DE|nr:MULTISPECIES: transposase [Rhodococcus]MDV6295044.1 transposase [Rhodococcus aetherivorans]